MLIINFIQNLGRNYKNSNLKFNDYFHIHKNFRERARKFYITASLLT